uniref:Uncharacterized protein n=1 Tax=Arundo donax TaxID=35708 RepID=A0A0A8ZUC1_ARUDO
MIVQNSVRNLGLQKQSHKQVQKKTRKIN